MSKVVMLGHPAPGHINPTLPIVAELVQRGEDVTYYATEPFRAKVEATGAVFRSYGAHDLFERNLSSGGMLGGMAGLIETTEAILPELLSAVRAEAPDYLLVEAHAVWGNLVAQMLGVPVATICSMFAINEELITPHELLGHLYGNASRDLAFAGLMGFSRYYESVRRLRQHHDVDAPDLVDYLGNRQALNIVCTSREFQIGGEGFDESYVFTGPSLSSFVGSLAGASAAESDRQWVSDSPLIYVSMGTMYNDEAALYRACFEAFGGKPYQVVMAVGHRIDRGLLPDAPANVLVRDYVPQMDVLRCADLFVTHGGINSAHEAMLCGVPMVVLPKAADHFVVAERVAAVGAGVVLHRGDATAARLVELTDRVLADPTYRERSTAMGQSLRAAGGAARAADEIQRHARNRSRHQADYFDRPAPRAPRQE
jgi:MGT family glycosyltransferase